MIKLYKQYMMKLPNGLEIYFIPLLDYPHSDNFWTCLKYGSTDIPAFEQLKVKDESIVEEVAMYQDIAKYIIKEFFKDVQRRQDIILGYKQGQKK